MGDDQERRRQGAFLAAQRRVAMLAAGGAASADVFAAIAREVGRVIGVPLVALWRYEPDRAAVVLAAWSERPHPFQAGTRWPLDGPTICAQVLDTGRPARIDDFAHIPGPIAEAARATGIQACAGAPIIVDGGVWGAMSADVIDDAKLPDQLEDRLAEFTELVAIAISHAARRDQLAWLADEQAALRRVATLVARESPPAHVFAAIAEEVSRLLRVGTAALIRYDDGDMVTVLANASTHNQPVPDAGRRGLGGDSLAARVKRTGRPARVEDYAQLEGPLAADAQARGIRTGAAAPILVNGRLWGTVVVGTSDSRVPAGMETRIAAFTELAGAAIAKAEARTQLARLAGEQAALRRVATLVAQGVPPHEIFAAVAREVGLVLGVEWTHLARYEGDEASIAVGGWSSAGDQVPVGTRVDLSEGDSVGASVLRTGRPARMPDYERASGPAAALGRARGLRSSVGAPIVVDQRLWGMLMVASKGDQRLPDDTESRIAAFTDLVATAISNTEARTQVARLADEQAALRRVATLVARGAPPDDVFATVTEEVGRVLPVEHAAMARYEPDGTMTVIAASEGVRERFAVGGRWPLGGNNVSTIVAQTGRPARIDSYVGASGSLTAAIREQGLLSSVGAPIVVEDCLWGVMTASSSAEQPLPPDTEARLALFTELVGTAIANAESRDALAASRARIVAATDETRRRIERDLHDGTQQRLLSLMLELRAKAAETPDVGELTAQLARTAQGLGAVLDELQEISRGIHPAILSQGGLPSALRALARRSAVPVELDLRDERRLREPVEVAVYYAVSEALTNAAKHAQASFVSVGLDTHDSILRIMIRDDGVGGADPRRGSGLVGLSDRIEALGGAVEVSSPPGDGTTVVIEIPVEGAQRAAALVPAVPGVDRREQRKS